MNLRRFRGATNRAICDFVTGMNSQTPAVPDDVEALKAALVAERERRLAAEADAAAAKARLSDDQALIAHQKLEIAKLRRELLRSALGAHSAASRSAGVAARGAGDVGDRGRDRRRNGGGEEQDDEVAAFTRKRPSRQPFPEHLPRERW